MSLEDFWRCSLWEFSSAIEGWNRANGSEETVDVTDDTISNYEKYLESRGYR